ncbi:hypothetical protein V6N13_063718 [Hibiscus sabdariffa]
MHLWSSEMFANIESLWGRLVRVEDNTVEPQSFERAHFLMETSWMERIEETVEILEGEDSMIRIQIQEVKIIHSHDIVCSCERESDDGRSETRVSNLQEDQMTRMNPLYCNSGEEDHRRDGEVRGMAEEFDIVGVVCREVSPELRLCEPEMWLQCTSGLWVAEAVGEVTVPRLGWRAPNTVFELVSNSTPGGHPIENLNFELEQMDNLNIDLVEGGLESTQQTEKTNFCPTVEFVQHNSLSRKVRSVNDLVVDTLSTEERRRLLKRQGKGKRGRSQREGDHGHIFVNESLTDSDFVARKTSILNEAAATVQLG